MLHLYWPDLSNFHVGEKLPMKGERLVIPHHQRLDVQWKFTSASPEQGESIWWTGIMSLLPGLNISEWECRKRAAHPACGGRDKIGGRYSFHKTLQHQASGRCCYTKISYSMTLRLPFETASTPEENLSAHWIEWKVCSGTLMIPFDRKRPCRIWRQSAQSHFAVRTSKCLIRPRESVWRPRHW